MGRLVALALCVATLFLPARQGHAHPHAFIDVTIAAIYNEAGQLTALEQQWRFDLAYTAFALFDLRDADADTQQRALDQIMAQNLSELRAFNYFTEITQGDAVIETGTAIKRDTALVDQRIQMRFTLPVTAVTAADAPVSYQVFDPTYYIQMRHSQKGAAITVSNPARHCEHELIEPTPTTEQILFAASIQPQATAPEGLGRLFAETVTITCKAG